jgi:hypothetical protein
MRASDEWQVDGRSEGVLRSPAARPASPLGPALRRVRAPLLLWLVLPMLCSCSWLPLGSEPEPAPPPPAPATPPPKPVIELAVYHRAKTERAESLEQEVARLRADLQRAEEALVAAESGLRAGYTRADAISTMAEAQIQVARAAQEAPWRSSEVEEARRKLVEAAQQVQQGHFGAAVFFVYRARRISAQLLHEAKLVRARPDASFVKVRRLNLRAGPSIDHEVLAELTRGAPVFPERDQGDWVLVRASSEAVGWVHRSLIGVR